MPTPPWSSPTPWTTGVSYSATVPASCVTYDNAVWVCSYSHYSGPSFSEDYWVKILESGSAIAAEEARDDAQEYMSQAGTSALEAEGFRNLTEQFYNLTRIFSEDILGSVIIFPTTAEGIAATSVGDYFLVPVTSSTEFANLYRHTAGGVATLVNTYPAASAIAGINAALVQSSELTFATWAVLSTLTGSTAGQGAEVLDTDTGTHTDPVVGGTVSNAGRYTWSASPAGWKRIGDTGLSGVNTRVDILDETVALNIGDDSYTTGAYPATDGTGNYAGGYTILLEYPVETSGFLSGVSAYFTTAGVYKFIVARPLGGGIYSLVWQSEAVEGLAGTVTLENLAVPVMAGDFIGVFSNEAVKYSAGGAGTLYASGLIGASSAMTSTAGTNTACIGYVVSGAVYAEQQRALHAEAAIISEVTRQVDGEEVSQGSSVDGAATVGAGGLTLIPMTAIESNGLVKDVTFGAAAAGSGALVLVSKNAGNQFTLIDSIPISFVVGLNTVQPGWWDCNGLYLGIYSTIAFVRYTASGGPGVRWTSGVPATDTASTLGAGWLLSLGWTIQMGIVPRIEALESAVDGMSAVTPGSLVYRDPEPLASLLSSASIIAIGAYGQSNSADFYQGTTPSAVLSGAQLYDNVMYSGGSLLDLVSVTTEKMFVTCANYASAHGAKRDGTDPADQVFAGFTAGVPGASISAIQSGSSGFSAFVARVTEIYGVQPSVQPIVNFVQGETDTEAGMTGATWGGYLTALHSALKASVNAVTGRSDELHFVVSQPAFKVQLSDEVVLEQLRLAQTEDWCHLGVPMYRLPYSSYDSVHTTNIGRKLHGAYFGKANAAILRGEQPQWLNPVAATFDGAVIRVKFDVPVSPLVLDTDALGVTTDSGFKIIDNGSAATISAIEASNDTVTITCSADLTGPVRVRYALDYLGAGLNIVSGASGSLRDSDPETITIGGTVYQLFNPAPHFELSAVNVAV